MIFKVLVLVMFSFSFVSAFIVPCANNTENSVDDEKKDTKKKIEEKQEELNDAIDDYKDALEKKKEMMQTLWTTTAHIEFLMKENQIMRKEMIKHWRDVKETQASGQSL